MRTEHFRQYLVQHGTKAHFYIWHIDSHCRPKSRECKVLTK